MHRENVESINVQPPYFSVRKFKPSSLKKLVIQLKHKIIHPQALKHLILGGGKSPPLKGVKTPNFKQRNADLQSPKKRHLLFYVKFNQWAR
jgi:hypothetical protein